LDWDEAPFSRVSVTGARKEREPASNVGRSGAVASARARASAGFGADGGGRWTAQLLSAAAAAARSTPVFRNLELISIKKEWVESKKREHVRTDGICHGASDAADLKQLAPASESGR
jgi:hypothetical protein